MDTKKLGKKLQAASKAYYNDEPVLSDEDFDMLRTELAKRDPDHPFLKQIGAPLADHLEKVKHSIPMGSLSNANNEEEYRKWHAKHNDDQLVMLMQKLDGSSIEIVYKDGKLVQAITRGDGIEGEDVTQNVRKFKNVPSDVGTFTGSVRGEAMLLIEDFAKYFSDSANPRNAANGTVRRSDGTGSEHLVFYAFDAASDQSWDYHSDKITYLSKIGFETVSILICGSADSVIEMHKLEAAGRAKYLEYEIDGMVARIDNEKVFAEMGESDNRPKGAVAFKFKAMEKTTILEQVVLTVGHTGAIIPTAKLKPVEIGGVTITSALLNNFEEIERLGVAINDEVKIIRAGDVIPKIIGVALKGKTRVLITIPTQCPVCSSMLIKDGVHFFCRNDECDARQDAKIKCWIKKRNILYLGDTLREYLFDTGVLKTPADLYRLNQEELAETPIGAGKVGRNSERIMAEIEKSRTPTLAEFMGSLGIDKLGRREAKHIIDDGVDTLEKWVSMTAADFEKMPRFSEGSTKAVAIAEGIKKVRGLIKELLEVGVKIQAEEEIEEPKVIEAGNLIDKSFCFTGKIEKVDDDGKRFTRNRMWDIVKANGGTVHEKPVAGTNYLVQADPNSQSSKTKKAAKLGVEILAEADFFNMV